MNDTPETPAGEVDPRLLELLVCPLTKTTLHYDRARGELISRAAGLAYPIRGGVPVMLPDEARELSDEDGWPPNRTRECSNYAELTMARLEDIPEPLHSHIADLSCPTFKRTPWVDGPTLSERRIAILSTAGLQRRGDRPFAMGSFDFRVIPGDTPARDLVMSHVSTNFDRTGFQQDINVVFPIDRLRELASAGVIAAAADYHYAFMGATDPMLMEPHVHRLAEMLKGDGVDTVLLIPIWPFCTRTVGVLGHFLERAGFATTQISLIRLHTETIRPPRALWVPFELGRPFGVPDDADFQRRVLSAALNLLGADDGPVLVEFPEEAPGAAAEDMDGWVCPILRRPGAMEEKDPTEHLLAEIDSLQQWYDLFVERNDRTSVGASGLAIADIARYLADLHAKPDSATPPGEFSAAEAVKVGSEDLKAFYFEASLGMPGHKNSGDVTNWFWGDTIAGQTLLALMPICIASDDADLRAVGKLTLVPRAQQYRVWG